MKQYYPIKGIKLFNAPVLIHWPVFLVIGIIFIASLNDPVHAFIAVLSYISIIFIHEFGHGFVARKLGYKIHSTRFGVFHGTCEFEEPYSEEHHVKIAWAGSLAQLMIAVPLLVLYEFKVFTDISYFGPIYLFLGAISFLVALVNLAPAPGLDGGVAWRVIPLWLERRQPNPKKKKNKFKVVK